MSYQEVEYRQSPFPPPAEIAEYAQIDPQFGRDIFDMVKAHQQAQIDALLIPLRAEAWALKAATVAVSFMPWLAISGALVFVFFGYNTAAAISAIAGAAGGGAQIINATRRQRSATPARE